MPLTLNGTTGIAGVDGSAGTPAVKGSTATAGVVYPATDTVAIATTSAERVRVTSAGTVNIVGAGTAGSTQAVSINGSAPAGSLTLDASGNLNINTQVASALGAKMYCLGYSGFGQSANGTPSLGSRLYWSSTWENFSGGYGLGTNVNAATGVATLQSQRFDGTATAYDIALQPLGGNVLVGYTTSNGAYKLQVNSQIFATSATIATSDARYKENVAPITDGLAVVNALNPVSFDWKEHPVHAFDTETKTVGFLAQEVQDAMADKPYVNSIVKESECELPDGTKEKFFGIAEGNMVSILTKAIQELSAKLDAAEARIAALEAK